MPRKLATFRRLTASQRLVLLQASGLLPLSMIALRLVGFRRWESVLATFISGRPTRSRDVAANEIREAARMVRLAAMRGVLTPTCLPRSQVLWFLLRRRGIDARLRVGVRKNGAEMTAHAWVECDGWVVNDRRAIHAQYQPFEPFDAVDSRESPRPAPGRASCASQ